MTIIYFLLLLTVIVCIHEFGHLIAAKIFGVYCYEYSFGMGPALLQKRFGETIYSLRAVPIGGFVSLAGEKDGDETYPDVHVPEGRRLTDQKPWKRIIILLAGVTMNFLLAWVLFSLTILSQGQYAVSPKAVIAEVVAGSPAEQAGLLPGDKVLQITREDGSSVKPETYFDMQVFLADAADQPAQYRISRNGEELSFEIAAAYDAESDRYLIGIVGSSPEVIQVNALNCWKYGAVEMRSIAGMMLTTIKRLFTGRGLNQLSGPVGIYSVTEQYVSLGFSYYILLMAELSLNVGIFNLLPLPVLDGGQVILTIGEWIAGKPLNEKVRYALMIGCWVILLALMVFVTWNDISRLVFG